MSKSITRWVLVAAIVAWTGCSSSGDNGGGGSGGSAASAPISFDADNALPASSGSAIAMALAADLGAILGSSLAALAEAPAASTLRTAVKQGSLPISCPQGGDVTLTYGSIAIGQTATLVFSGCAGSALSERPLNGNIELVIEAVSGGLPTEGTATLVNLTAGTDTNLEGTFKVKATLLGASIELLFGDQRNTDQLTITRDGQTIEFACFRIRQVVSLLTGAIDGAFEPVGVVRINGNQVFTLNDYEQTPPSVTFSGGVAVSGSVEMSSGDRSALGARPGVPVGGLCAPFGNTPTGDNSIIANSFSGETCVEVTGQDASGNDIDFETTWSKLLNADFSPGGATCEGSTPAVEGPDTCELGGIDRLPIADTFINGDGPEADRMLAGTNFGASPNLLAKSVFNLGFTRKIYLVFDISDQTAPVSTATLVLTLERHVEADTPETSGPQPFNFYGITDDDDWDPDVLAEDAITWNNAPRNANDWVVPFDETGVPVLITGYDFRLGGDNDQDEDGVDDPGTRYAFDFTDYVNDRIANDADGKVTILIAHFNPTTANVNTSTFYSKEHADDECNRPFLRLE
jgi:hypothetical protein